MTVEDDILKELKWHTKLMEAEYAMFTELKFELINSRKLSDMTYTIPIPEKKKGFVDRCRERVRKFMKRRN